MHTVASPDPDPNPRGGVNYLTLTSGTRGIYLHCYILMLMSRVIGYELSMGFAIQPLRGIGKENTLCNKPLTGNESIGAGTLSGFDLLGQGWGGGKGSWGSSPPNIPAST